MRHETKNLIITVASTLIASAITGWIALQSSQMQSDLAIKQLSSETARAQSSIILEKASVFLNRYAKAFTYRLIQDPAKFDIYRQRELLIECQNYALEIQPYLGRKAGYLALKISEYLRATLETVPPNWKSAEDFSKEISTYLIKFLIEIEIEVGGLNQKADPTVDNSGLAKILREYMGEELQISQDKWYEDINRQSGGSGK
ncbi:hypothetical protein [Pseudomonas sp. JBR1]|uniref:hypothetical protein n=1 Tax=Pseudomonas sp. JBR1 TaxID=3020907 RepID=UPI002304EF6B|nr:hypothetical protein [Pseudomonas sp. JBR1]WCE09478.1 hypothetical protein PJ259_04320 [Pseudomonas sp. JBR1]